MPREHRTSRRAWLKGALAGAIGLSATPAFGVVFGQLDDFQNGTTMGWVEGASSPNPPTNIPNGGPNGVGDAFLQNICSGGLGAGSKQIMFNLAQWTGDFTSNNVTRVSGSMANQGTQPLHMRAAIRGGSMFTIYGSTNAVVLPADGVWRPVTFTFNTSNMSLVAGTENLPTVLSAVGELRILSAEFGPSFVGDAVASTLGVDNLRALTIPGDANFDGVVNLNDFNVLATNFGTATGATWQQADFDFNGTVNLNDFNLLAANFGVSASSASPTPQDWAALSAAVPEPSTLGLLSIALVAATRRRTGHPR